MIENVRDVHRFKQPWEIMTYVGDDSGSRYAGAMAFSGQHEERYTASALVKLPDENEDCASTTVSTGSEIHMAKGAGVVSTRE